MTNIHYYPCVRRYLHRTYIHAASWTWPWTSRRGQGAGLQYVAFWLAPERDNVVWALPCHVAPGDERVDVPISHRGK